MSDGRPTWAEVDLDALRHNLAKVRASVGVRRGVIAVVKANAYGHGALPVAAALVEAGVEQLAVASIGEALELRAGGISHSLLVLSGQYGDAITELSRHGLEAVVCDPKIIGELEEAQLPDADPLAVHIKLDSGMGRLGCSPGDFAALVAQVRASRSLRLAGVMTHLARADEEQTAATDLQLQCFGATTKAHCDPDIIRHAANSAAIAQYPEATLDRVRPGLALYGVEPVPNRPLGLQPVLAWHTRVAHLRHLASGSPTGYGGRWQAPRPSIIGILPVGYADGYPWSAEGRAEVLIKGRRAPLVGAISMDLCAVDLTDIEAPQVGDRCVLIGNSGAERVDAAQLAKWSGRLVYEVLTGIGSRVRRHYRAGTDLEAGR